MNQTAKVYFSATTVHIDKIRVTQKLETQLTQLMMKGAEAFVEAAADRIPIWSGMAMGSLLPLAEIVRMHIVVNPVKDAPDRTSEGRSLSAGASFYDYFKFTLKGVYTFDFTTNVMHFATLDDKNYDHSNILRHFHLITQPPWGAIPAGLRAFKSYISKNKHYYVPRIEDIIVKKKVEYS